MIALLDSRMEARVGHLAFRPVHLRLALPPGAVKVVFSQAGGRQARMCTKCPQVALPPGVKSHVAMPRGMRIFGGEYAVPVLLMAEKRPFPKPCPGSLCFHCFKAWTSERRHRETLA